MAELELRLREAFAALATNRPYPAPGAPEAHRPVNNQARILRLLFICGAQPAIDIGTMPRRGAGYPSRTVATIIGREAGCGSPWVVGSCVEALCKAGLVRFARQILADPRRYQVLEDEPDVATAWTAAREPLERRGSLCLTPVAEALCRRCSVA